MFKIRFISMLVLLCLTVSGAWAQNPSWVRSYDTWDEATKTLTVNTDPDEIDYAGKEAIEHVIIANTVTTIGEAAFKNCSNLTSVSIPSSVTNIGSSAFESTGLTSVTIPGNVTTIGENAFFQCGNLTTVILGNGGGSIIGYAFDECGSLRKVIVYAQSAGTWKASNYMFGVSYNDKLKIYVPSNLVDDFKKNYDNYWVLFSDIIVAIPTSDVSLKGGTEDATSWRGKAGEGNYQALPLEGVAIGKAVSVKYSGWKLVKSVKATKEADPPGKPAAQATAEDKGKLIGTDGNIYDDDVAATDAGTTAVAKIVYIGATGHGTYTHGLALALTDEGLNWSWEVAIDACSPKNTSTPVTNATWLLASKDQWEYMMGTNGAGSYEALRDGSNLGKAFYWSSTESSSDRAWYYDFLHGDWSNSFKWMDICVRACLVF